MASGGVSDAELRILLVGKTGCGKSATANTIIGDPKFKTDASASSCTKSCQVETGTVQGRTVLVVDSPGFFDTSMNDDIIREKIKDYATLSAPGPHAIIYVVSAQGRFTKEEIETAKKIRGLFGPGLEKHLVVLITRTEGWANDEEPTTAKEFMKSIPPDARSVLSDEACQDRSLAFTNLKGMATYKSQVDDLFRLIDEVKESNQGGFYSDKYWQDAQSELVQRAEKILRKNPGMRWVTAIERARKEGEKKLEKSRCSIL